ncbi:MAG: 16S rRNA (adenine(1518)-N(6)/adenine(1519)-N(6))-dimethyltransferase RsmA [Alphaproteobacteria bacterium]|nr:16S rRNA (adenine(1518)-N(6)/adenine(1519)-N(6))-dimethyltransferase RsmA [Alphaproteobacteria bacterium]
MAPPPDRARLAASDLPPLREVIARHGIGARRQLGQHFLLDLNLTRRIARAAAPLENVSVIEIGAGPGGLTRALLEEGAGTVIAIERDKRCIAALAELSSAYPGRLTIIEGDALAIEVSQRTAPPRKIVANLPYNIATPLLLGWLRTIGSYRSLTLMFQKEVADRLVAAPRQRNYGRLSVVTQWLARVERLFDVPAQAFVPPPKVTSTVVRLEPHAQPLGECAMAVLERVTAAAFGQRRKMLRASLRSLGDSDALLAAAGVPPTARAEELDIPAFCRLAQALDPIAS